MHPLTAIVLATTTAGVVSVLLAALFLATPERVRVATVPLMVSFAIGSLLGAAFFGLLPEAFSTLGVAQGRLIGAAVVAGLLVFFLIEKLVLWRHCHRERCEGHPFEQSAAGALVIVGDTLHNFIDGLLIAAAFLSDSKTGVATAIAVAAHELPQEVGDFAVLLHSGFSRRKAFLFNTASGFGIVIGGLVGYAALTALRPAVPLMISFAAASFIYIAAADLIPEQHKRVGLRATTQQLALIASGAGLIWMIQALAGG
jgi:zinc and cadmium transporter